MSLKKILCTVIVLASYMLLTAFAPDCPAQFIRDIKSSTNEYDSDVEWCNSNAGIFTDMCLQEATASLGSNITGNLAALQKCCCDNNLVCC